MPNFHVINVFLQFLLSVFKICLVLENVKFLNKPTHLIWRDDSTLQSGTRGSAKAEVGPSSGPKHWQTSSKLALNIVSFTIHDYRLEKILKVKII